MHSGRTVVIVIRRFIQNFLHSSRKNSVFTRFIDILPEPVIPRFADLKNFTKNTTKKYVVKSNKALAKKIAVKKAGKYYVKVKAYKGSAKTNSYTRVVRIK